MVGRYGRRGETARATDGMTIRLHLRRTRVVRVVEDKFDKLVIEVADRRRVVGAPRAGTRPPRCMRPAGSRSELCRGRAGTAGVAAAALRVPQCGHRHTEDHPEIEGKVTRRLTGWLVRDSKYLTIRELSRRHRLSWHLIMGWCGPGRRSWGPVGRESRCRVLLITSSFYGVIKEGAP
jgi:hypothetical protein